LDPSHVILGKNGRATLLGWSQSHAVSEKAWLPHNQLQLARYTAPECFDPNYVADTASDVYSLGALIYHSLTLKPPVVGSTLAVMIRSHRHHLPVDLQFVQPLCPPVLSSLVKEMLRKNPATRPSFPQVLNRLIAIEIEHLNDQTMIQL
jgi:serine/threonine protein kinase